MKKLISLFLALVTILGILPTAAFAASSEEEALGEVDIYNGDYELGYLSINGAVRKQKYTYFLYESNDGTQKESPAYCVNPNQYGVPQTVGPGESIKYLAEEKASDPKVVGIISNGYPHRSLGELELDNKYQAYYATKMAFKRSAVRSRLSPPIKQGKCAGISVRKSGRNVRFLSLFRCFSHLPSFCNLQEF